MLKYHKFIANNIKYLYQILEIIVNLNSYIPQLSQYDSSCSVLSNYQIYKNSFI